MSRFLRSAFSSLTVAKPRFPVRGLEEFRGPPKRRGETQFNGEAWTAAQLRLKSDDDLHKLWYVLLKERNQLLTEDAESRSLGLRMEHPIRKRLVRKSMARIKVVFGERSRAKKQTKEAESEQQTNTIQTAEQ